MSRGQMRGYIQMTVYLLTTLIDAEWYCYSFAIRKRLLFNHTTPNWLQRTKTQGVDIGTRRQ
jgi:hypothetical protein